MLKVLRYQEEKRNENRVEIEKKEVKVCLFAGNMILLINLIVKIHSDILYFVMLGISHILRKCSTTELYLSLKYISIKIY